MKIKFPAISVIAATISLLASFLGLPALAQGTAFTYQGRLNHNGAPADGSYDLQFALFDAAAGGSPIGSALTNNGVAVSNGLFTVALDFGSGVFTGADRWLFLSVRTNGAVSFAPLTPPQHLTAAPYAITAGQVSGAVDAVTLGGLSTSNLWQLAGNGGTTPGANFLGTTDSKALELKVNAARALRLEPGVTSPNLMGGYQNNLVLPGKSGATIGGGGSSGLANTVIGDFGVVGGGLENVAANLSVVGGGQHNQATGPDATVGGGFNNSASYFYATVGGGYGNTSSGAEATVGGGLENTGSEITATVAGGANNTSSGVAATVGGGSLNFASGDSATISGGNQNTNGGFFAAVGGGKHNLATGNYAMIPGGVNNTAAGGNSFAAGTRAQANHNGSFIWADMDFLSDFGSTAENQFLIRARGGVGIGTSNPTQALDVRDGTGPSSDGGHIHVGGTGVNGDPKLINFGDGDFVHIGENGADDTMEIRAARFFFKQSLNYGNLGLGITNPTARLHLGLLADSNQTNQPPQLQIDLPEPPVGFDDQVPWLRLTRTGPRAPAAYWDILPTFFGFGSIVFKSFNSGTGFEAMSITPDGGVFAQWFSATSDRNAKEDFAAVDTRAILEAVAHLPIETWDFKRSKGTRHLGPMAQDFYAAFKVGVDDKHISMVDADGVALAAIQGLNEKVEVGSQKSEARNRTIEERLQQKETEITELKQRLEALEKLVRNQKSN